MENWESIQGLTDTEVMPPPVFRLIFQADIVEIIYSFFICQVCLITWVRWEVKNFMLTIF